MILAGSRQTLFANLSQQVCAAALLLTLPNLLTKVEYAEIVFVSTLLSFIVLSDLGFSLVYGRVVPSLLAQDGNADVADWDATVLGFGLLSASVFSILIAVLYWARFHHVERSLLVLLLPIATFWLSFHVSRISVRGEFSEYRRVVSVRSLASLLAILMTAWMGLLGWFVSQLIAALVAMLYVGRRLFKPLGRMNWPLVRSSIPEGLMLCVITALWLQLLNLGRLYASVRYGSDELAHYGVVSAASQSLSTLLISAFLPATLGLLRKLHIGDDAALEFVDGTLHRTVWWAFAAVVIVIEASGPVLTIAFPKYQFADWVMFPLLAGISLYPFLILFGTYLVGKKQGHLYLGALSVGFGMAWLVAELTEDSFPGQGAAWGQLAGLVAYSVAILIAVRMVAPECALGYLKRIGGLLLRLAAAAVLYLLLRSAWISM